MEKTPENIVAVEASKQDGLTKHIAVENLEKPDNAAPEYTSAKGSEPHDLHTDYSSKSKNVSKFKDYLVPPPHPHLKLNC